MNISSNCIYLIGCTRDAPVWHAAAKPYVTFQLECDTGDTDPWTGDWTPCPHWFPIVQQEPPNWLKRVPQGARMFVAGELRFFDQPDESGARRTVWKVVATSTVLITPLLPEQADQAQQAQPTVTASG